LLKSWIVYLGKKVAALAGNLPAPSGEQGMMSAAEPLLAAFLGRKAAFRAAEPDPRRAGAMGNWLPNGWIRRR